MDEGDPKEKMVAALKKYNLPELPEGCIPRQLRHRAGTGDWYLHTDKGWFWVDGRYKKEWKKSALGPD